MFAIFFSKVNSNEGSNNRLETIANSKVIETKPPRAIVPPKLENKVLKKFSGMVRSQLSRTMKIRRVPIINFRFDESIEYSENIEKLLQDL